MSAHDHLVYDRDAATVGRSGWLGSQVLSYDDPRPQDVLDVLDIAVHRHPDAVAVVDATTGRSWTALQLAGDVVATAEQWTASGVRAGDGVGIAAGNGGEHLVAILACAATGAVAVGLSSRLAVPQWRYQVQHSGCRLLLHDDAHAPQARATVEGLTGQPGEGLTGRSGGGSQVGAPAQVRLSPQLCASGPASPEVWRRWFTARTRAEPGAAYQVVYTSGSTGRPKASQVVHRASVHSGIAYDRLLRLQPGESTGVLFHLGYISAMHAHVIPALLSGARLVMMPSGSPRTWLEQLGTFDVAWAYAVPSWWLLALQDPRLAGARLPRLRLAGAGGSPFPDTLRDGLAARLPDVELLNIYGLSETHSPATVLRGEDLWRHAGTAGRALEVVEVEVRDGAGARLPDGQAGEVWLRSSLVTSGYAHDESATAAAVVAGALRTGDVGVLEPAGDAGPVLRLLDRVKDMVNRAGTKVYSAEVERVLGEHPALAASACVAAPDARSGETVAVFLVAAEGAEQPADTELRAWVRQRLGSAAVPSILRWVDVLPRGGTGKTDKLELRRRLAGPTHA